jgi:hypothetical protein
VIAPLDERPRCSVRGRQPAGDVGLAQVEIADEGDERKVDVVAVHPAGDEDEVAFLVAVGNLDAVDRDWRRVEEGNDISPSHAADEKNTQDETHLRRWSST